MNTTHHPHRLRPRSSRRSALIAVALAGSLALGACGSDDEPAAAAEPTTEAEPAPEPTAEAEPTAADPEPSADAEPSDAATAEEGAPIADVTAVAYDTDPAQPTRIRVEKVDEIAALVPAGLAASGQLKIGVGAFDAPPIVLYADDEETLIGNEVDIAYLVADTLGLELIIEPTSWENLFLAVESGQFDAGFSNITVTEERKEKYDFASYRVDSLAWEAVADNQIEVDEPADIAGLTVSVGSGTNQEQILLAWVAENEAAGLESTEIQYFQGESDFLLALESGRIDLYFGPAPSAAYRHDTHGTTKIVGVVPGGGDIPAQIAAMTAAGSGWAEPIAAAINHVIQSGDYQAVLDKWGLTVEAIETSEVNPPGLPKS